MVTKLDPAACVVGLGFIGLPTAVLIANEQIPVLGVDIKKEVVDSVNAGSLHFVEPGLESLLKRVVTSKQLRASIKPEVAGIYRSEFTRRRGGGDCTRASAWRDAGD
jgi:UDP-N-acetyl-D-mannosaminuronic acid dehydrogenase